MSGIAGFGSNNSNYEGFNAQSKELSNDLSKIEISDIDDSLDSNQTVGAFKKEVSGQLKLSEDKIEIISGKSGLTARDTVSKKEIPIEFKDKLDLSKIAKASARSSNLVLINLGDEKNDKQVKLPNYPDGLTREQSIDRFKNDLARELKADLKDIQIFTADNEIVATKKGSPEKFIIKFQDPDDQKKFTAYTDESYSRRLLDFGDKKHQGEIHTGFGTNLSDPKHGTTINTGFTYSYGIGDHQRVIVSGEAAQNPSQPFSAKTLQRGEIIYQNSDIPILGDYSQLSLKYEGGGFKVSGKSEAINLMASDYGKKKLNEVKSGDPTAILQVAGAVAVVGGALYLAKDKLKERVEFDIPLKSNVYRSADGVNTVGAFVAPSIGVGGHHLDVSMHKLGVDAQQNVGSGQVFRERIMYDTKEKSVETEVNVNYNNLYVRAYDKYSTENKELNRAEVNVGYNQIINDKTNAYYSLNQGFDSNFKPVNTYVGAGVSYRPDNNWTVNAGLNASLPNMSAKPSIGAGASISYRF